MKPISWTDELDKRIRDERAKRKSWDQIAAIIGVDRAVCTKRGETLGLPRKFNGISPEAKLLRSIRGNACR